MRIGLFTDTFLPIVDGVGRVVYNYASTLARKGHQCTVVAPMADTGYRGGYPFELVDFVSVNVPTHRHYSMGIPPLDPHYDARISDIPLEIAHAHSPFMAGQEALRIGRKRGIPVIGTFHSRYYDDFYKLIGQEQLANIAVRFVVNFYERCDAVWTVSANSAEVLHDYGYRGDIAVVPNGTPDVEPNGAQRDAALRAFHLPEDRPILLYCGQMNWKKNIRNILEACAILKRGGRPFLLVLAGQGPDAEAIGQAARMLGLGEDTLLTGHVRDDKLLFGLYQCASLFVFPSLYDTSGMVVREAAAMETASVVTTGSAPAEPIRDGENGFLCRDTPEDLARVLREALADPERLAAVGKNARKTIYLSWDAIIDEAVRRYGLMLEMAGAAARTGRDWM